MQMSADVLNAMLDAYETTIGTAPTLTIRTGAAPASFPPRPREGRNRWLDAQVRRRITEEREAMTLKLRSRAFHNGEIMPDRYVRTRGNVSPPLPRTPSKPHG